MTDVFSHPWLGGLFADDDIAACFSGASTVTYMLAVEAAYARALGQVGHIAPDIADRAAQRIQTVEIDVKDLRAGTAKDGVVVPSLVAAIKEELPVELHPAIHNGMTSQDVIDTALVMSLKSVVQILISRLTKVLDGIGDLVDTFGDAPLLGRTRMQAAIDMRVCDRLAAWRNPLMAHHARLVCMSSRVLVVQLGGAVGNRATFKGQGAQIAPLMASELGLSGSDISWQADRSSLAEFANCLSLISGALGKIGTDVTLMAQQGVDEISLSGGGASSAMPHKQNPILAELLVTLARYNAVQLSGMHQALVHEQERSGAAWMLEWMVLPQMCVTTARALAATHELLGQICSIGKTA